MKHSCFDIQNFKGISQARLDVAEHPTSNVYTLVGLNESGKTTILEAINFLGFSSEKRDSLDLPGYSVSNVHDLTPINRRANFTDSITVKAGYILEDGDQRKIEQFAKSQHGITISRMSPTFEIVQSYNFVDSQVAVSQPKRSWSFEVYGRTRRSRTDKKLSNNDHREIYAFVRSMLPSVLYFPNLLFDFPEKIYLEDVDYGMEKHQFYRVLLQDILDALDEGLDLERHILSRAKSDQRNQKQALDNVLLKIGTNVTEKVFNSWNQIFRRKIGNKQIVASCEQDDVGWFLSLQVRDGNEQYTISERSLGFRWFFVFLLLTQYRGFRKDATNSVVFLLDEPASNLHPSAQAQLLESFGRLPNRCSVIYTTHSHHMINPAWLEGAFVVRNEGLEYTENDDNYSAKKTNITLEKYRTFAAKHPHQSTYFQPVLDVLNYAPGKLENVPDVVMVEGKNDFYLWNLFQ